jgi:hypothetical protein
MVPMYDDLRWVLGVFHINIYFSLDPYAKKLQERGKRGKYMGDW